MFQITTATGPAFARAVLSVACAFSVCAAQAQTSDGDAALRELTDLLKQPVYAASRFALASADAPVAMTVLSSGDILTYGWRTLAEVLNGARGVLLREDRAYSYIGVRGFGRPGDFSQRVLITIDGMRINDAVYDQALPGREFPLEVGLIERVEFIPGPGSALYGSNAMVAVINVVTKSAGDLGGGNASAAIGSQGARAFSLRHGMAFADGLLVLGAHLENRPGGDLYFAEFDDGSGARGVARGVDGETDRKLFAKWRRGAWQVMALWSEREKQVPTAYYGIDFGVPAPATDRYAAADLQWRDSGPQLDAFAHLSLVDYRFLGRYPYGADAQVDDAHARWLVAEGSVVYRGWADHRVVLGVEFQRNLQQRQRGYVEGANPADLFDLRYSSQRLGAFVSDEWSLTPTWRVMLGARWDRHTDGTSSLTPRASLVWQPVPSLALKWVDGRAYREPSDFESRYEDPASQRANPELRVEQLRARELVLDWRALPNLRLTGSLFRNRFSALIDPVVDAGSGLTQYQNTPGVTTRGVEAEADYVTHGGWRLRASWAGLHSQAMPAATPLVNAPRSLVKLHSSAPLPWDGAVLGLEWLRVGQRQTLAGAVLPAHQLTGITLRLAPAGAAWSVSAGISNAFDAHYADPAGPEHLQDSLSRDGRSWRLQYTLAF